MATLLNTRIRDLALFKDAGLPDLNVSFHHEANNSHSMNIWGDGGAVLRVNWCAVPAMIERRYHVGYEYFHNGRLIAKDWAVSFLTIEGLHGLVILLVRDVFCCC